MTKEGTITIKKDAMWRYSTFALLGILVIGAIMFIMPDNPSPTGNVVANTGVPENTASAKVEVTENDHFIKGDLNSKVTVVEWSDFECPYCARAFSDAVTSIKESYSDEDVAIVYRQFPLGFHANAQKAAEATECAGDQGKFTEMHDILFTSGVEGGISTFKSYASQIGLDTIQFDSCLDSGEKAEDVASDLKAGQSAGIKGTPGFIIIGEDGEGALVSGAQPFAAFKQIIDSKL